MNRVFIAAFATGLQLVLLARQGEGVADANLPAFAVLCRVLETASGDIPIPRLLPDNQNPKHLQGTVHALIEKLQRANQTPSQESQKTTQAGEASKQLLSDAGDELCKVNVAIATDAKERLKRRLGLVADELGELATELEPLAQGIEKYIGDAQRAVGEAIYGAGVARVDGDNVITTDNKTLSFKAWVTQKKGSNADSVIFGDAASSGYGNSCGNTGDKDAGKTLVNDFFCICAAEGASGAATLCGNSLTAANGGNHWTKLGGSGGTETNEAWEKIRGACKVRKQDLTPLKIHQALSKFHGALGSQVTTPNEKSGFILGKATGSTGCTGTTDGQVCVHYYKPLAAPTTGRASGIPWENKLLTAADSLEKLERTRHDYQVATIRVQHLIRKISEACELAGVEQNSVGDVNVKQANEWGAQDKQSRNTASPPPLSGNDGDEQKSLLFLVLLSLTLL